ncbi:protein EARLY FLOWERING 3-like [Andrographis paniculata]|uniref:protein EARLY FLOWERING 3-like n=1 Tax=Andrographis paniculata TaxID=175694 RepID=UPI0021E7CB46|nr:protein EARLY FLOWERING 3-like [Andrographis paniculata]XP_051136952.1 protein EARLY FLOWERING 3-like [Andrographis paniculata]
MKRGKDGEKIMEPMFPRLHVKDTEKGGPRAPPRNKMALYEQLSIPSHRFSHVVLPCDVKNTSPADSAPPRSQVSGIERSMFLSGQLPSRLPSKQQGSQYSDLRTPLAQVEKRKKLDEDDYRVPVFDHSTSCQDFDKFSNDVNRESLSPSDTHSSSHSQKAQETVTIEHGMRQEVQNQKENDSQEFAAGWGKSVSYSSSIGKSQGPKKQAISCLSHEPGKKRRNDIDRLTENDSLQTEVSTDSRPSNGVHIIVEENMAAVARRNLQNSTKGLPSGDCDIIHDVSNDSDSNDLERVDSVSETSILDAVYPVDITPDDVVGIIGQKHFWKARRAIANQQRVFAVQVFELHRLIEVQKLIAASPHLLLEDSAFLDQPFKPLPEKKTPAKPLRNPVKQKDEPKKPKDKNSPFSSTQNRAPPANCQPQETSAMNGDHNMNPWCYSHQPPPPQGHQWLVPVMSPSEGLIYKPYAGPGFSGQGCGGCGPPGSIPMMGNFFTPAYYQLPSYPHGYFPHYPVPVMNTAVFSGSSIEQTSRRNTAAAAAAAASGAVVDALESHVSVDIEVQASTGSSPSERWRGAAEGGDVVPVFVTSSSKHHAPTTVIRVVPHNAVSASESAARIFRAIQEGRKQRD